MRRKNNEITFSIEEIITYTISIFISAFLISYILYFHYKLGSSIITIIPSIITAGVAAYVGYEARKITKEQKKIAESKLFLDIYEKKVEFIDVVNKIIINDTEIVAALLEKNIRFKKYYDDHLNDMFNEFKNLFYLINRCRFFYNNNDLHIMYCLYELILNLHQTTSSKIDDIFLGKEELPEDHFKKMKHNFNKIDKDISEFSLNEIKCKINDILYRSNKEDHNKIKLRTNELFLIFKRKKFIIDLNLELRKNINEKVPFFLGRFL